MIIPQQFGFREKHSCINQLQKVTEYATIEINKNRITQLILVDLEKVFDTVWHEALQYKRKIKTPTPITNIIKNYLQDRQFYISVQGTKSETHTIKAGVPYSNQHFSVYTLTTFPPPPTPKPPYMRTIQPYTRHHGIRRKQRSSINATVEYMKKMKTKN